MTTFGLANRALPQPPAAWLTTASSVGLFTQKRGDVQHFDARLPHGFDGRITIALAANDRRQFQRVVIDLDRRVIGSRFLRNDGQGLGLLAQRERYSADPEITSDRFRVVPSRITGEGVGIVEAMRGTLTHHYTFDTRGICTSANLIVGTTNNNAPIHMLVKKVASATIRPGKDPDPATLNMIEMAFRAFDPCFSCATHSLPGQMPLEVRIFKGERLEEWRRGLD